MNDQIAVLIVFSAMLSCIVVVFVGWCAYWYSVWRRYRIPLACYKKLTQQERRTLAKLNAWSYQYRSSGGTRFRLARRVHTLLGDVALCIRYAKTGTELEPMVQRLAVLYDQLMRMRGDDSEEIDELRRSIDERIYHARQLALLLQADALGP